jgi:ribosomal peptide maturation radical SAM protein 1
LGFDEPYFTTANDLHTDYPRKIPKMSKASHRILLIVPPFASILFPSMSAHQLEAQLRAQGFVCDIFYSNSLYASIIGFELYHKISWASPRYLLGERIFAKYLEDFEHSGIRKGQIESLYRLCRNGIQEDIDEADIFACLTKEVESEYRFDLEISLLKEDYSVVGITCGCMQLCAAEYHAGIVRRLLPDAKIVIGGANCEGVMAEGIATFSKNFDHIFSGEGDLSFPAFCQKLFEKNSIDPIDRIIHCDLVEDLAQLEAPNFHTFYEQMAEYNYPKIDTLYAVYQSSRGCWWGQKSQCAFCGLNGATVHYRVKPIDKVIRDLQTIMRNGVSNLLMMVDCIMPYTYMTEFLPRVQKEIGNIRIFYETKANLTFSQLRQMKAAGVLGFQPGIESFSTSLLKRMHKGVSGVSNIRLLINSKRANLYPSWNILWGFPGDVREDYLEMLRAVPYLVHLIAPTAVTTISLDRFSPLFEHPEAYGITNIKPSPSYSDIFSDSVDLNKIGYHFFCDFPSESLNDYELCVRIVETFDKWRLIWRNRSALLKMVRINDDNTMVIDTRGTINESSVFHIPSKLAERCFLIEEGLITRKDISGSDLNHLIEYGLVLDYEGVLINLVERYKGAKEEWEYDVPDEFNRTLSGLIPGQFVAVSDQEELKGKK